MYDKFGVGLLLLYQHYLILSGIQCKDIGGSMISKKSGSVFQKYDGVLAGLSHSGDEATMAMWDLLEVHHSRGLAPRERNWKIIMPNTYPDDDRYSSF